MDIVLFLIDLILHIDRHLLTFVNDHGAWAYGCCSRLWLSKPDGW